MPDAHLITLAADGAACADCPYRDDLLAHGLCQPGDICARAHSGRQIDRFLRRHPNLAERYLDDGFWERRAIAARYAPIDLVRPLAKDPDEVVRRAVATRLPPAEFCEEWRLLMRDPDREVRKEVARRLPPFALKRMVDDEDVEVRRVIAGRLLPADAIPLLADLDWFVRLEAAGQAPVEALAPLLNDPGNDVRERARQRIQKAEQEAGTKESEHREDPS